MYVTTTPHELKPEPLWYCSLRVIYTTQDKNIEHTNHLSQHILL